jgi:protein phosphatase
MKIALLADAHGNVDALEAVLKELGVQACDEIVFVGDLVMNGPHPVECLARIMALSVRSVIGNTDLEVLAGADPVAAWTRQRLSSAGLSYLAHLPISYRIAPKAGLDVQDDLLVVHSTPRSPFDLLILKPHPLGTSFKEVTPKTEATEMVRGIQAELMVSGHLHYASERRIGNLQIASLGSVGFPYDGDTRAAYAVAIWDDGVWRLEHRRVAYDGERVARTVETSDMPFAQRYAAMIRRADWLPRSSLGVVT